MADVTLTHNYIVPGTHTAIISRCGISVSQDITVQESLPATPTGLTVGSTTYESVTATWDPVPGAIAYQFGHRVQGTTTWTWTNAPSTTGTATGLIPDTDYEVTVKAVNASGESPEAAPVAAKTAALPAPTALTTSAPTASSVDLTWGTVTGAEKYIYQHRKTSEAEGWNTGTSTAGPTTTATDGGLEASTPYTFRVAAQRGTYTGPWSSEATATTTA